MRTGTQLIFVVLPLSYQRSLCYFQFHCRLACFDVSVEQPSQADCLCREKEQKNYTGSKTYAMCRSTTLN